MKKLFLLLILPIMVIGILYFVFFRNNKIERIGNKQIFIANNDQTDLISFTKNSNNITILSSKIAKECSFSGILNGFVIINGNERLPFIFFGFKEKQTIVLKKIKSFDSEIKDLNVVISNNKKMEDCSLAMPVFVDDDNNNFLSIEFVDKNNQIKDKFISSIRQKLLNNLILIPKTKELPFYLQEVNKTTIERIDEDNYEIRFILNNGTKFEIPMENDLFWIKVDESFANGHAFFWDDQFISWFLTESDSKIAEMTLDFWYDMQIESGEYEGLIPREIRIFNLEFLDKLKKGETINPVSYQFLNSPQINNPFITSRVELELYEMYGDKSRLRKVLPKLVSYFRYVENKKKDKTQNLYYWDRYGSGMDNLPRCGIKNCGYVDLIAQQAALASDIQKIAIILDEKNLKVEFDKEIIKLGNLILKYYYNSKDGFFYDVFEDNNEFVLNSEKTIAPLWVLYSHSIPNDIEKTLIQNHFLLAKEFGGELPFSSLPKSSPKYNPAGGYWMGGVWPPLVWIGIDAISSSKDFKSTADEVAIKYFKLFKDFYESNQTLYEYYSPELVDNHLVPGNQPPARDDFFGWGVIPLKLFYYLNCDNFKEKCE